jgi:RHS repeat-associated protein
LTQFTGGGSSDTFQLDGVGNWMRRNNAANQVNAMNEYEQIGGVSQRHDDNGNLTDDGRNRYEYDALNRLHRVTRKSDNAVVALYRYDAFNRRIERTVTNSNTLNERVLYLYDGWQEVEERRGNTVQQYVYGMWIDEPLTLDRDDNNDGIVDQSFYYHQDGKTNVTALTNSSGGIVQTITYDAYGRPSAGQSSIANPYLLAGRRYDPETGLYYFRARFYDPVRGRFLQRDPIGIWTDKANLGNGYTYVGNNPMSWTDPLGLRRRRKQPKLDACTINASDCDPSRIACCGVNGGNGCACIYKGYIEAGDITCEVTASVGSCTNFYPILTIPPDWQTCAYSPVFALKCSGGELEASPDGQVSPLILPHFQGGRKDPSPPSPPPPPPPPPQGPGFSRCGGQVTPLIRPNGTGIVIEFECFCSYPEDGGFCQAYYSDGKPWCFNVCTTPACSKITRTQEPALVMF